jgi:DNA-binding transcriptional LysR family regulator
MELKLLRAFLTVVDARHFGQAAETLALSQPALSKQIAALEASLGARLFERGRHGAELTTFGASFLPDAAALVRDADALLARAREAGSGARGRLRIGVCISVLPLAPRLIAEFRRGHPQVDVTLHDLPSDEQTRRMLADRLDVGFMRMPDDPALDALHVVDECLGLALPPSVRFTRLPARLETLNALGFVALTRSQGAGLAAQVDRWCGERGFTPRVTQHADDIQTVLAAVVAEVGAAFVPSRAEHLLRDARVLRLRDAAARWQIGLAWPAHRDKPVTERFVAFMRDALATHADRRLSA